MADGGWIKLYRSLLDDELWLDCTPVQKTVMITLLLMANHAERKWVWKGEKFHAKPGQFRTSLDSIKLKAGNGVSVRAIRTSLDKFEKLGFLTNESTKQGRLVTIANWAKYQLSTDETTNDLTVNRQSTDNQLTPNKNVRSKEVKPSSHKSAKRTFDEQSKELRAATKLWELIQRNNPKAKQQDLQKWADVFRLMHERDNRSWKDIGMLIQWSQNDSFWSSNILSAKKLREKFDQLTAKMNQEGGGFVPEQPVLETPHTFSVAEWATDAYRLSRSIDEVVATAKSEGVPASEAEIRAALTQFQTKEDGEQ
ncbi:DNA replication protein DnaD [Lacticaseibacillus baoqingensis]|uniref:DNA replication protein DnaD n=1 Tax=Lacticaseibacillus baoqingensis TaxID=2486013 RepID=A0ABW4E437_9LACO|nr:DNA replication protein DnaD [Lacticaseibacillus baoqingensis]